MLTTSWSNPTCRYGFDYNFGAYLVFSLLSLCIVGYCIPGKHTHTVSAQGFASSRAPADVGVLMSAVQDTEVDAHGSHLLVTMSVDETYATGLRADARLLCQFLGNGLDDG